MKIFLDYDSVLVDLIKSTCQKLNINYPSNQILGYGWILKELEKEGKDISECYKVWEQEDIWENTEIFPWAQKLVNLVYSYDPNFMFVTKPIYSPNCYSGKFKWTQKHFPQFLDKLIILNGSKSILVKNKDDLLIDDNPENIREWENAGGSIFYWPEVTSDYDVSRKFIELEKKLEEIYFPKIELEEIIFD